MWVVSRATAGGRSVVCGELSRSSGAGLLLRLAACLGRGTSACTVSIGRALSGGRDDGNAQRPCARREERGAVRERRGVSAPLVVDGGGGGEEGEGEVLGGVGVKSARRGH